MNYYEEFPVTFSCSTLVLIDASHLMYRYNSVFSEFKTTTGIPTGILFGCAKTIEHLKKQYKDSLIVFVFDGSPSNRRSFCSTYKANREGDPAVHDHSIKSSLIDMVLAAGCATAYHKDHECDDLIANLCFDDRFPAKDVIIYSGDDDFCQLAVANMERRVRVLKPGKGKVLERLIDSSDVYEEWGVHPRSLALYRSFVGDTSDEIKGLPRIPRKPLLTAVATRSSPEEFYPEALAYFNPDWKQRLIDFKSQCETNFRLTKLPWEWLKTPILFEGFQPQILRAQFGVLEFKSMLKKFDSLVSILGGSTDGEQSLSSKLV